MAAAARVPGAGAAVERGDVCFGGRRPDAQGSRLEPCARRSLESDRLSRMTRTRVRPDISTDSNRLCIFRYFFSPPLQKHTKNRTQLLYVSCKFPIWFYRIQDENVKYVALHRSDP